MRLSLPIDLKLRLALRVVALAALCFIAASTYAVVDSNRTAWAKADGIATLVAKDLDLQQDQLHWVTVGPGRSGEYSPDLQVITAHLFVPGLCIAYRSQSGAILQRMCSGREPGDADAPRLFAMLYRQLFKPGQEIAHPTGFGDRAQGAVVVSLDAASLIGQSWRETSRLLTVMAVTLAALCLLVYAALARALQPTRVIRHGLEKLAANDLSTRLPAFDLAELSAVRDVFNTLAEKLQATLAERNELTKRLIAVQDEERRHLARELHDEFGQCLAAISAVAAAASQTAQEQCPALLPECESIARTAAHMMEVLRGALMRLRPPDVEVFGLTASLESLIAGWNSRSRGRTCFELDVSGSFDALPLPLGASLYRIAQEAITNAAKHAEAHRVALHLHMRDRGSNEIELTVEDDGKASPSDLATTSGMGILGMRERIASLGGRLSFTARLPNGLIMQAVIAAPQVNTVQVANAHS
jgi:signal transduction histidine kinase